MNIELKVVLRIFACITLQRDQGE